MEQSIKSLIKEEVLEFKKLNESILSSTLSESQIDILAQDYEKLLKKCLDFPTENFDQFKLKYDFMLTVIMRDYGNEEQIEHIRKALFQDIKHLEKNT